MRWFTADQHFGHENIVRYCGRPFPSVAEMNTSIVDRYNSVVGPLDTAYWLGDVVMGDAESNLRNVGSCVGAKTLVVGNHDRVFKDPCSRSPAKQRWEELYRRWGFAQLVHGSTSTVLINGMQVKLCHFPYVGDSNDRERFNNLRPQDNGDWLLHGHVHEKWRQRGHQMNVGVDAWGGYPVSEATICQMIDSGPQDLDPIAWD